MKENYNKSHALSLTLYIVGAFICQYFAPDIGCTVFLLLITALAAILEKILSNGNRGVTRAFWLLFCCSIFACGISCIYRHLAVDAVQNELDAYVFFQKATAFDEPMIFAEEGLNQYNFRFATLPWMIGYKLLMLFNFTPDQYTGQFINTLMLALGGLFTVKSAALLFPNHKNAEWISGNLLASYGFMYVMGAIMLRDVFGFTYFSILFYLWSLITTKFSLINFIKLASWILFGYLTLDCLRDTMQYIPLLTIGLWIASVAYFRLGWIGLLCAFIGASCIIFVIFKYAFINKDISSLILGYNDLASGEKSLAYNFIFSMPISIRWLVGFWYLLVFPFPIFASLLSPDSYGLFKSIGGVWMIYTVPMTFSATWSVLRLTDVAQKSNAKIILLFSALLFIVNYAVTGLTSIETRHTTPAIPAIIVLATYGILSKGNHKAILALSWCSLLVAFHLIWMVMKFI